MQVMLTPINQATYRSSADGLKIAPVKPSFQFVADGNFYCQIGKLGINFVYVPDGRKIVLVSPYFPSSWTDNNIHRFLGYKNFVTRPDFRLLVHASF